MREDKADKGRGRTRRRERNVRRRSARAFPRPPPGDASEPRPNLVPSKCRGGRAAGLRKACIFSGTLQVPPPIRLRPSAGAYTAGSASGILPPDIASVFCGSRLHRPLSSRASPSAGARESSLNPARSRRLAAFFCSLRRLTPPVFGGSCSPRTDSATRAGGHVSLMSMGRPRFDPRQQQRGYQIRVNHRIRVPEVRVIDADGPCSACCRRTKRCAWRRSRGSTWSRSTPRPSRRCARSSTSASTSTRRRRRPRRPKRKQTVVEIKEIKLRPKTDDHDINFKIKAARRFLEAGHKVKFTVRFRGREITHPEKAHEQLAVVVAGDWRTSPTSRRAR